MEDFIGIVVLVVIWMVAASGSRKKKAEKQKKKQPAQREARFEQAFAKAQAAARPAQTAQPTLPVQPTQPVQPRETDCSSRPLHLHEVTPRQMELAGEGEDPCHAGHAPLEPSPILETEAVQADPRAQELVRAVVMSEILKRPCERMAERHNRRRA